jgi:hypothetical protein
MIRSTRTCPAVGRVLFLLAVVLMTGACGTAGAGGAAGTSPADQDLITREEILSFSDSDALVIVQRLRPRWLRPRTISSVSGAIASGQTGADPRVYPVVFQDAIEYGLAPDALRSFSTQEIERMEFISAVDATTLYGTGYMGGIIRVVTRRGG